MVQISYFVIKLSSQQKLKNSVQSDLEECPCCGQPYNSLDHQHHQEVRLVVFSPNQPESLDVDDKTQITFNDKTENPATVPKVNGLSTV